MTAFAPFSTPSQPPSRRERSYDRANRRVGNESMSVTGFDHVAVPTANPLEMLRFYRALGFDAPSPDEWRASEQLFFSIQFGDNKINVHAPAVWQSATFTL